MRARIEILSGVEHLRQQLAQRAASHKPCRNLRQRHSSRLGDIRHRARRTRVHFNHVDVILAVIIALNRKLQIHQPHYLQRQRQLAGIVPQCVQRLLAKIDRRQHARGITRVDARLFNVLHDARDQHVLRIAQRIHVHFHCVLKEVIHQYRPLLRVLHGFAHVARHGLRIIRNHHRAPAQHVAGPHQHWIPHPLRNSESFFHARGRATRGLRNPQVLQQLAELLTVFRQINRLRRCADNRHARSAQSLRKVQRSLPAKLHNHPDLRARGRLVVINAQHVFQRQRFEVKPIARVVIRRYRLRIAVHHDRLVAVVLQRKRRMAAAVVKLNALPDTIRPRTENNDLRLVRRRRFILFVVGRVEIRRHRLKLCRARIYQLEDRPDALRLAQLAHALHAVVAFQFPLRRNALVAQPKPLQPSQILRADRLGACVSQAFLRHRDFANLMQEPRVHRCQPRHLAHAHPALKRKANVAQPLRPRSHQHLRQPPRLQHLGAGLLARLQSAPRLHQRLFEGAAHRHHLAHRLHLRAKHIVRAWELFKLPLGNLHHDVIDRRLKARRRLSRNVVRNLVERVAHRELRCNLSNREARRLRSQRRGPRHARIHLDHRHAPVQRVHGKLHIRSACLHADLTHHGNCRVAHLLILAIRQRLRRGNGDRVARVHAHRVKVLNRADDDDVIREVAHHLQLILFPAQHALFNQALMHRREIQPARKNLHQLFAVVGDAAARSAQRKAWPDEHREAYLRREVQPVAQVVHQRRL